MEPDTKKIEVQEMTLETKEKDIWLSKTVLSGTAMLTLLLTLISLYFKAIGHNLGEAIPLVILAFGTYGLNVKGRLDADTRLKIPFVKKEA